MGSGRLWGEIAGRAGLLANRWDGEGPAAGRSFDGKNVPYFGGRAGLSCRWENLGKHSIEFCGKYFCSHGNGKYFEREEISFRPVNSHRVRLGGRLAYQSHWKLAPWCGAFYEREFAGTARGSAGGLEIPQPSLKGGSTAGELGLSYRPSAAAAIDLALHGSTGRQNGVSGSLRACYEF
jgi:hypothetical protein